MNSTRPLVPEDRYTQRRAPAANNLIRACYIAGRAVVERSTERAVAERLYPTDDIPLRVLTRAAAPLGTTTGAGFAAELVQSAVADFLGSLVPQSAAAALMRAGGMVLSLTAGAAAISVPIRPDGPALPGWVPEGSPIPVQSWQFATVPLGPTRKIGSLVAASREAMQRADAERVFAVALGEDAARGLDAAAFSDADGSGDAIAGLLDGATEVSGSGSPGDPDRDLAALAAAVGEGGSGQVAFVTGPGNAAALALDATRRATILPSIGVPETRIIAVDPASLVWGADPSPDISSSIETVIHMDSDPDPIVAAGPTVADPVRSAWQTDSVITRLLLHVAFAKRRTGAVAYIDDVDYWS